MIVVSYTPEGKVHSTFFGFGDDPLVGAQELGLPYVTTETPPEGDFYVRISDLTLQPMGESPGDDYEFDYSTGTWVESLEAAKARRWEEIKADRKDVEFGQLTFEGNVYDIDEVSQRRIQGAVQLSMMDPSFTVGWTLANNEAVTLNATQVQQLGAALAQQVDLAHQQGRFLRKAINMASTTDEVNRVEWNPDYNQNHLVYVSDLFSSSDADSVLISVQT